MSRNANRLASLVNQIHSMESTGAYLLTDKGDADWSGQDSYNDTVIWARYYASRLIAGFADN